MAPTLRNIRFIAVVAAVLVGMTTIVVTAPPAHADRCQPEEFVLGSGNSPYAEESSYFCDAMLGTVYPALAKYGCDSTTLLRCINGMTPGPVPNVSNPVPAQGPLPDVVARPVFCVMETGHLDSLFCSVGP